MQPSRYTNRPAWQPATPQTSQSPHAPTETEQCTSPIQTAARKTAGTTWDRKCQLLKHNRMAKYGKCKIRAIKGWIFKLKRVPEIMVIWRTCTETTMALKWTRTSTTHTASIRGRRNWWWAITLIPTEKSSAKCDHHCLHSCHWMNSAFPTSVPIHSRWPMRRELDQDCYMGDQKEIFKLPMSKWTCSSFHQCQELASGHHSTKAIHPTPPMSSKLARAWASAPTIAPSTTTPRRIPAWALRWMLPWIWRLLTWPLW